MRKFFMIIMGLFCLLILVSCSTASEYIIKDYYPDGYYNLMINEPGVKIEASDYSNCNFGVPTYGIDVNIKCEPLDGYSDFEDATITVEYYVDTQKNVFTIDLDSTGEGCVSEYIEVGPLYSIKKTSYSIIDVSGSYRQKGEVKVKKKSDTYYLIYNNLIYTGTTDSWWFHSPVKSWMKYPKTWYFTNEIISSGKKRTEKFNGRNIFPYHFSTYKAEKWEKNVETIIFDGDLAFDEFFSTYTEKLDRTNFVMSLYNVYPNLKNIVIKNLYKVVEEGEVYNGKFTFYTDSVDVFLPTNGVNFYVSGDAKNYLYNILQDKDFVNGIYEYSEFVITDKMKKNG